MSEVRARSSNSQRKNLARADDSDSRAQVGDFASRAPWRGRMTNRLPEGDQDSVVLEPVAPRQHLAERNLGSIRRFGFHQAPSIGNAMDMSIDADSRLRESLGHDQVGGFAADTLEGHQ